MYFMTSPLQNPSVQATIGNEIWNISTTTSASSNLYVCESCWLLLICVASYPIAWYDKDARYDRDGYFDELPGQNKTYPSNSLGAGKFVIEDDGYISAASEDFRARLVLTSVTRSGTIICRSTLTRFVAETELELSISVRRSSRNQIASMIQTGFDTILLPNREDCSSSDLAFVPFIYSIPSSLANISQSIVAPNSVEEIPLHLAATRIVGLIDSSTHNLSSSNLFETKLTFSIGRFFRHGVYVFIVDVELENGTCARLQAKFNFTNEKYKLQSLVDFRVSSTEFAIPTIVHGQYRITFNSADDFSDISVRMRRKIPKGAVCVFADDDTDIFCGLIGLRSCAGNLDLLIQGKSACNIYVRFRQYQAQIGYSTEMYTFYLTVADALIFGNTPEEVSMWTVPEEYYFNLETLIAGDPLQLICCVPACAYRSYVAWCPEQRVINDDCIFFSTDTGTYGRKQDTGFTGSYAGYKILVFEKNSSLEYTTEDSKYSISFTKNMTMVFEKVFTPLTVERSGFYTCMYYFTPAMENIPRRQDAIELTVTAPLEPTFDPGCRNVSPAPMQKDEIQRLKCTVTANPPAFVQWLFNGQAIEDRDPKTWPHLIDEYNTTIEINEVGIYTIVAENRFNRSRVTFDIYRPTDTDTFPLIIGWTFGVAACFTAIALATTWWIRRRSLRVALGKLAIDLRLSNDARTRIVDNVFLNDQTNNLAYNQGIFEVERSSFELHAEIGRGHYGRVWRGVLTMPNGTSRKIAAKGPADNAKLEVFTMLLAEMKLMAYLEAHVNVLGLVGANTKNLHLKTLYILTDFCEFGSLESFMQAHRKDFETLTIQRQFQFSYDMLLSYAYQAASGMEHLARHKIVHRDIALRNVLLTEGHVVKVSDFGLSRFVPSSVYKKAMSKHGGRQNKSFKNEANDIPLYWMALESIGKGEYTEKSDIWSFGILLWELFSCGRHASPDFPIERDHETEIFYKWLEEGFRLGPTRLSQADEYALMRRCWQAEPLQRPTFSECRRELHDRMNSSTVADVHQRLADEWTAQCALFQQRRQNAQSVPQAEETNGAASAVEDARVQNESTTLEVDGMHADADISNHTSSKGAEVQKEPDTREAAGIEMNAGISNSTSVMASEDASDQNEPDVELQICSTVPAAGSASTGINESSVSILPSVCEGSNGIRTSISDVLPTESSVARTSGSSGTNAAIEYESTGDTPGGYVPS